MKNKKIKDKTKQKINYNTCVLRVAILSCLKTNITQDFPEVINSADILQFLPSYSNSKVKFSSLRPEHINWSNSLRLLILMF